MKQRILTTVLALLAIVTGVQAGVKLGDNEITASGTVSSSYIKSGSVSYNKTTNTLTLNNATINVGSRDAICFTSDGTLVIIGTNSVTGDLGLLFDGYNLNIRLNNNQSGSVTFVGSSENCGIFVGRSSTLAINEGCFVTAQGGWGIAGADGTWDETVTINKATVHATGTQGSICDLQTFTLTDCGITSPAGAAFTGTGVKVNGTVVKSEVVIEPGVSIDEDHFPDANFRSRLASTSIDKNGDGFLTASEIAQITSLNVYQQNIADLTGIEYFTALTSLDCRKNQLTSLNVSQNTALTSLDCRNNQFTSLDVSHNTAIKNFYCSNNQLTQLDVSQNTALITLYCDGNQLTQLDVSHNPSLENLSCFLNRINDDNMTALVESMPTVTSGTFYAYKFEDNEQNECYVYHANVAAAKGWTVKSYTGYTLSDFAGNPIPIDEAHFPDAEFRRYLSRNTIDTDADGYLSEEEIAAVTSMDISSWGIQSLQGIEYFTALMYFNCNYSHVTELDLTKNMALKSVSCSECKQLQQLSLPKTETLTTVNCNDSHLMTLELTGIPNLQTLKCENNSLTQLFVNNHTALTTLACYGNNLQALGITGCSALTDVWANRNLLTALNLEGCSALKFLSIYKNQIKQTAMDNIISQLPTRSGSAPATITLLYTGEGGEGNEYSSENVEDAETKHWRVYGFDGTNAQSITADYVKIDPYYEGTNYIKNFPDENFRNYVKTYCDTNGNGVLSMQELMDVTDIDVHNQHISDLKGIEFFTALTSLNCGSNPDLVSFDLSRNTLLTSLDCSGNNFLESLDITANEFIGQISCYECSLTAESLKALFNDLPALNTSCSITIYKKSVYEKNDISLTAAQISALNAKNWHVYIIGANGSSEELTTGVVCISQAYFPDSDFRGYIKAVWDTDGDLLLTDAEAQAESSMVLNGRSVADLTGLERFTHLTYLDCRDNQLTTLDVSNLPHLSQLYCQNNQLVMLDVTGTDLYELQCYGNQIKGELMQLLINSLPADRTTRTATIIVNTSVEDEGNDRPSMAQVRQANDKNWDVLIDEGDDNYPPITLLADVEINMLNFPDDNFRDYVSKNFDSDKNGFLCAEEIENVKTIKTTSISVGSYKGIEFFTELTELECHTTSIDLSKNTKLEVLDIEWMGNLTTIDLSHNTALKYLNLFRDGLLSLDLSHNTELEELYCSMNSLTELDLSHNTKLRILSCHSNNLTDLDLSHNPDLESVRCTRNKLTALDLTSNPKLKEVFCDHNYLDINNLNVQSTTSAVIQYYTRNTGDNNSDFTTRHSGVYYKMNGWKMQVNDDYNEMWYSVLHIMNETDTIHVPTFLRDDMIGFLATTYGEQWNQIYVPASAFLDITEMDVSGMDLSGMRVWNLYYFRNLETLKCNSCQLTQLDLSYFPKLTYVECYNNNIQGDNLQEFFDNLLDWSESSESHSIVFRSTGINEQNGTLTSDQTTIAMQKGWSVYSFNPVNGSYITDEDPTIEINAENFPDETFRNFVKKHYDKDDDNKLSYQERKNVKTFIVMLSDNTITSLKGIEYFTELTSIDLLKGFSISTLDVSNLSKLEHLSCKSCNLTSLNLAGCNELVTLNCEKNQLTSLDVSHCPKLTSLDCSENQLEALDVSHCPDLGNLDCSSNQLTTLDLSGLTALNRIYCNNNNLTSLNLSGMSALDVLWCYDNKLTSINLSGCLALRILSCSNNQLTELDISMCPVLKKLECYTNQLTTLDLSKNKLLEEVYCRNNQLSSLDLSNNKQLTLLYCYSNQINEDAMGALVESLPTVTKGTILPVAYLDNNEHNHMTEEQAEVARNKGWQVRISQNGGTFVEKVVINATNFPDENFRNYVKTNLDTDHNGSLNGAELDLVEIIDVRNKEIADLTGIEWFTSLKELYCDNNQLTALDLSANTELTKLTCSNNAITTLQIAGFTKLISVDCSDNQLASLRLVGCTALETVNCPNNQLTALLLTGSTALKRVTCNDNQLTALNLSNRTALEYLDCKNNLIQTLYITGCTALKMLNCTNNKLTTLSISSFPALEELGCDNNLLTALTLTNNPALHVLSCSNNQLTEVDLSQNPGLIVFICKYNNLSALDVTGCTELHELYCGYNQLTALDLSHNTALQYFSCYNNKLTELDLSANTELEIVEASVNELTSLVVSPDADKLFWIICDNNRLSGVAIDNLIASLHEYSTQWGVITLMNYYDTELTEHNSITVAQVAEATRKGWTIAQFNEDGYLDYYYGVNDIITGDVNGDSQVTIADVTALVNIILGKTTDYDISVADVNGDNNVTIADVTALVNIILGKTTSPSKVKAKRTADADTQGVQSAVQAKLPEKAIIRAPRINKLTLKDKTRKDVSDELKPHIQQRRVEQ